MKVLILKENLTKALLIVGKGLSLKPQLPILSHILIKAKNNRLEFFSTNLELGIIYNSPAKVEREGEVAVPGKLLTEFINSLLTDKIELETGDKDLKIKTNKTQAHLAIGVPADFPPFPDVPQTGKKLSLAKIKDAVLRTVFAASSDEGRPVLTGVKTTISDGFLFLSATDGYRLSREQVELTGKMEPLEVILPAQSLTETIRIADELAAQDVELSIIENKNQVVFSLPNTRIFTRLIDGEFPNVEKIIPAGFKTKVIVDRDLFHQAVKTTSIFARGTSNIVRLKIGSAGLNLSAATPQVGSEEDFVEADVEGDETEISFNFRFLLDLFSNFPDKELVFESLGPLSPGVFKPKSAQSKFLHIIMPVRIQN
ncbi:DNA polymerase III subunit beta [Candidatus Gottesmanbacteria bacterium RIFCSPHIGHO2_02_FULL_40_24]|uniref:Beta sliding clamp n=1 Tax=Candidatus Gottesmanbacteria bacterium RIFCSPHIGHO2_01_FULL_40_15 TaxID=1798376 RepID=A0A1F5Z498_9BACT|nr:MAG: DNA polymerase III subunit beta [Candidatus Gottesmanbacteria bacterium RIFCSPHIGHO2_01_FULL_40_15]OGG18682.1 MAG: DNA polymerase III subunit beta [Candidatus Gottesmanbacteria bacterium RIFCSPHIGHO2_02_FULL_40_24]OGG22776.1 MAG: DNA polymerase III subunit beta [Candidatus Gottesmanbacteria bacterium RIFCSPLOWO2_01_FULL_40_10]OGG22974.1 MAG: DNA polymerase III subunit beta [Candidatus Gottesmanbacteria bacterium RIFCSPHIGHO2_12_FULL_40_13]OGG31893.1 MAG: DNA polymerase III subunit beta 